jgi:hypothetical protein
LDIKSKRARLNQNKKVEVIQPYVLVPQAFSTESFVFGMNLAQWAAGA